MPSLQMIDIVVPVYRGFEQTRRCLESILACRLAAAFEIVIVDDASTEPGLPGYLDRFATNSRVTLLRNESNQGFVRSVNRGMALHPERDVVLLNSDTEVVNDWLDRLCSCIYSADDIGTATPFSNNATICSYPRFCHDNAELPDGLPLAAIDALFREVNAGRWLELPTAVGFCMYIRRACLEAVGCFDEEHFGRGYGEENDFSLRARAAGWKNVLCADVFVYHSGSASFGAERERLQQSAIAVLRGLHPDYEKLVQRFIAQDPVRDFRLSVDLELAARRRTQELGLHGLPSGDLASPSVRLHVLHDLGGGAAKWLEDYCAGDHEAVNLVLRPFTSSQAMAEGVALYRISSGQDEPVSAWRFSETIYCTRARHDEYRKILASLIATYDIREILVSSLIGHSLDVLDTALPTTVICHDYYPYCPAINLYYGEICRSCDDARLESCFSHNFDLNPFVDFLPAERKAVRDRYLELLVRPNVAMVTPSDSVASCLLRIDQRFGKVFTVTIPHGVASPLAALESARHDPQGRLRILVLGQLSVVKGSDLLSDMLDSLLHFADIYLVGCRELGELYSHRPGVSVLPSFTSSELPGIVARIDPHLGLLLSICPESYSYTLGELMMLGIPPVVTRVGSFVERISHGSTGFLYDPNADALLQLLNTIDENREILDTARGNLAQYPVRGASAMVADYHRIRPRIGNAGDGVEHWSETPLPPVRRVEPGALGELARNRDLWKSVKSLSLQLSISRRARDAAERQLADGKPGKAAPPPADEETGRLEASLVLERNRADAFEAQLREIYSSRIWALLAPLRELGKWQRRFNLVNRSLWTVLREPRSIPRRLGRVGQILRTTGLPGLKGALVRAGLGGEQADSWESHQINYRRDVRPRILACLDGMKCRPLISIIVPTFNTPEHMLREMLASVKGQLYPHWELCIADDGSDQPHVKRILEEHAGADQRIKLVFGAANQGVSHASNAALASCSGEFVVLLDHDDLLEEHALFRVAQSICADGADMLYSDEVLVTEDAKRIKQFVFRPAFSPEYLRGHPYIVHLVGFRKSLLLDIGGFDERLTISQDYDLILRASERARTIVHIPDILYRWRIHGSSAGHQKMNQVMATSSEILGKHLQRCGEEGRVGEGAGFNLFDIRYPLDPDLRVAIVIPTKNHGDLLRQCIDSIRATVFGIRYDLIVIDHESDEQETVRYLESLAGSASVLRYEGKFNFSAMNNWAVSQLSGNYSHILLCNNDIQAIKPGWLERMLEIGQRAGNAVVGAKLLYPDRKTIQHAGVCVGAYGRAEHYGKFMQLPVGHVEPGYLGALVLNHEVSAVTAACMLVQAHAFRELGGFDESILVGFGDVDLCLRAVDLGYRVIYCAHAELIHHESYTRGVSQEDNHPEDTARFLAKWKSLLEAGDPYYNPGLSLYDTTWQPARPMPCAYQVRRRVFRKSAEPGKQQLSFSAKDPA